MFTPSNGWFEKFKQTYRLRKTRITSEVDNIQKMSIQLWTEHLPELTSGYNSRNIWNMDEMVLFFKALPKKDLVEKLKRCKGGRKSKQRLTATFFVAADGSKIVEFIVIWKSKSPRSFKNIQNKTRTSMVHFFQMESLG